MMVLKRWLGTLMRMTWNLNLMRLTEIDWTPQEDSAPSTGDYSPQSEEELDGIEPSNTVR